MKIFTTGQVAKICDVSVRTISKWFDSGKLGGYRMPMSLHRRIPENELRIFLTSRGMSIYLLDEECERS